MDAIELLLNRASVPAGLHAATEISDEALEPLFMAAMTTPDHGVLRPWRFLVIRGAARERLGEVFAEAARRREPEAEAGLIEKDRRKPLRSPVLIAVIARLTPDHPKVPEQEQLLSAGMAGYNMVLAAQATGLGAVWLTGAPAYDAYVHRALGLGAGETLVGFVYVGHPSREMKVPRRPDWREFVQEWQG